LLDQINDVLTVATQDFCELPDRKRLARLVSQARAISGDVPLQIDMQSLQSLHYVSK